MKIVRSIPLVLATFSSTLLSPLLADSTNTIEISANSLSMAGSDAAGGPNAFSAYRQPAALALSEAMQIGVSVMHSAPRLDDAIVAGDSSLAQSPAGLPHETRQASDFAATNILALGLNLPIMANINFGFSAFMPSDRLASVYSHVSSDPQYLLYNDRIAKPGIYSALSARLPFGLSMGLGLYYTLSADGRAQIAHNGDQIDSRLQMDLKPEYIPYGGLHWQHNNERGRTVSLAMAYRQAQKASSRMEIEMDLSIEDANLPLNIGGELVAFYDPAWLQIGSALDQDIGTGRLSLQAAMQRHFWSDYKAPVIDYFGDDNPNAAGRISASDMGLRDANSYHLGTQWDFSRKAEDLQHSVRGGLAFRESAVESPDAIVVVDADVYTAAIGYGMKLMPAVSTLLKYPMKIDFGLQQSWLSHETFKTASAEGAGATRAQAQAGGTLTKVLLEVGYEM